MRKPPVEQDDFLSALAESVDGMPNEDAWKAIHATLHNRGVHGVRRRQMLSELAELRRLIRRARKAERRHQAWESLAA